MPRELWLDALGEPHHVMARGIDGRAVFRDDRDRDELLQRLSDLVRNRRLSVYAWALMPNHFHLLARAAGLSLETPVGSLLAGFTAAFNRRHGCAGDLFENPYKSVVCRASRHFVELVRYIHLNPLRGGLVRHVDDLDDYPYTGHSALLAMVPRGWQSTEEVLARFGRHPGWARAAYRKFVCDGALLGQ
ncbi:MAG: transposase [Candidatus Binatia bacterium]